MRLFGLLLIFLSIALSGCGSVMSEATLKKVDRNLTLDMVNSKPDAYAGRSVLWGGVILASENLEDSTEIEVLETGLYYDDTPQSEGKDVSRGRFIIKAEKYLDTAVFRPSKRVTVAGVLKGAVTKKIGKMDYVYPIVMPMELKLFDPVPKVYINVAPVYAPY